MPFRNSTTTARYPKENVQKLVDHSITLQHLPLRNKIFFNLNFIDTVYFFVCCTIIINKTLYYYFYLLTPALRIPP